MDRLQTKESVIRVQVKKPVTRKHSIVRHFETVVENVNETTKR